MDGLIWTILIGFVIGVVAKFLMPGNDPAGFIITTVLGIAGSAVGAFLGRSLGIYTGTQTSGFVMSVVGAMVLLFIYHMVRNAKTAS